jgi:hypothetical protein
MSMGGIGGGGGCEEVEKVAQGGSEGETVPDCIHDFCRTVERACRGGKHEKLGGISKGRHHSAEPCTCWWKGDLMRSLLREWESLDSMYGSPE